MRFRLRTLLIVLALGPPVLAGAWYAWREWQLSRDLEEWNYAPTEQHPPIVWDTDGLDKID